MRRPSPIWIVFCGGAVVVTAALAFVSVESLALERSERAAREEAHRQEQLRSALWRMEGTLAPILGQESARPGFQYEPFYTVDQTTRGKSGTITTQLTVASPLLGFRFDPFRVHFQIAADQTVTSPQVPPADAPLGVNGAVVEEVATQARAQLEELRRLGLPERILGIAGIPPSQNPVSEHQVQYEANAGNAQTHGGLQQTVVEGKGDDATAGVGPQQFNWNALNNPALNNSNAADFVQRAQAAERMQRRAADSRNMPNSRLAPRAGVPWETSPMAVHWIDTAIGGRELVIIRTAKIEARTLVQGIWVNWSGLKDWLLADNRETFPAGDLLPAVTADESAFAQMLATVPVLFDPGPVARLAHDGISATRVILGVSWVAIVGAVVAVGLTLRAAMDLGERRGRFVSAVTHELRTPLTTFRMYTQMLADGMVTDEQTKCEYVETLRGESDRLARVVESVLLYSRLEEGRGGAHRQHVGATALIESVVAPLEQRARDGGMDLVVDVDVPEAAALDVDVQAVEQILLNLVDNACKYAGACDDRRIEIRARTTGTSLVVACSDHGPGVPQAECEAVFLPFRRAARDVAGPTPGVGLGLSVARGLARALGGELRLMDPSAPGATFELCLPLL